MSLVDGAAGDADEGIGTVEGLADPAGDPRGFVAEAMACFVSDRSERPDSMTPLESRTTTSVTPASARIFATATPAAPAPETTTRIASKGLSTTRSAFVSAARTTTAVPCWSSCMTGMSRASLTRSSISKQRGAEMSSRLTAPKVGAMRTMVSTISSVSLVSSTIGMALMPEKLLNRAHLPSITGSEAAGPISPRPSTAEPSETTATRRPVQVCVRAICGSSLIAVQTLATPGV
jgi:hypothetical protein